MTEAVDFGRIIERTALLERLRALRPVIVALIAPAGFGKSTLARQFLEDRDAFAICECAGVTDDLDLARRIIPALAQEQPERAGALSQREMMIGEGAMSADERLALALATWRDANRNSTFVFENAEHIASSPKAGEFLTRLLAERPETRTIVLCSRQSLRIHLSRFAPPHRIVTLRAEDLAFMRREVDAVLAPLGLNKLTVDRIFEISQGWPIPVLFLARLAYEGRHEGLLQQLDDVAFEELHEYLVDQVVAALPEPVVAALFAAACIPAASAEDIVAATGNPIAASTLADFARSSPFVQRSSDGIFIVHPLMTAILNEEAQGRRDEVLRALADDYERRGDHERAAELHFARPHQEEAARCLDSVPFGEDRAPSMRFSRIVSSLDRNIVKRHPTLWCAIALLQTYSADTSQLLEETGTLFASLPPDTPLNKRYYAIATRTLLLTYLGMFNEALKLMETVAPRAGIPTPPVSREHGYALFLYASALSRIGRIDEAERDLEQAWPLIESMDIMASATLMIRAVEIERVRGNFEAERNLLGRSLEYVTRMQLSNFMAHRLAEATFGEWLAGDDESFALHAEELERIVDGDGIRGFRFFTDCVRGRLDTQPRQFDLPRAQLCGHLVACANADNVDRALVHATAAREVGRRYPNPFLQALAALAVAEYSRDDERQTAYNEARDAAGRSGSPVLVQAVAAAEAERDAGMLKIYLGRLRARRRTTEPRLDISLVSGEIRCHGKLVKLPEREHELLLILAQRQETFSRERLTDILWPESDEEASANALKVLLHHLRQRLGDDAVIVRTRDGMRLCDDARVDLWEIDRAVAVRRSRDIENDAERETVLSIYRRLNGARAPRLLAWDWFEPIDRHIRELRAELGRRLARYALRSADAASALALANEAIANDPCDEPAQEITIAAYLALGDRASAMRQFRRYREILAAELQCEPSRALAELLQSAEPATAR